MDNKQITKELALKVYREFEKYDKSIMVVIKGHLLVEESLNVIIDNFVHHPSKLAKSRLSFFQKIHLARSMSVSDQDNSVWKLIEKLNSLRNDVAHKLNSENRQDKIDELIRLYEDEIEESDEIETSNQEQTLKFAVSFCLGFLMAYELEVKRFRKIVDKLDATFNK